MPDTKSKIPDMVPIAFPLVQGIFGPLVDPDKSPADMIVAPTRPKMGAANAVVPKYGMGMAF